MLWLLGITSVVMCGLLMAILFYRKRDAMRVSLLLLVTVAWLLVLSVWLGMASLQFQPDRLTSSTGVEIRQGFVFSRFTPQFRTIGPTVGGSVADCPRT